MDRTTTAALAARLDILSIALQAVAGALAPAQAVQVADVLRRRAAALADDLAPAANEAVTGELVRLLAALQASAR